MKMFICKICMESFPLDQCFKTATFRACFNSFCGCCIAKYIEAEISNSTTSIQCPLKADCYNHILNPLECKGLISRALFDRWCNNLCELAIQGLGRCHCPNMGCLELIIDECGGVTNDVQNRKITCPGCKISCCFGCSSPWQDGHRCSRSRNNHLPRRNNWQRCPGCRYYVERSEGCKNIRCRCGTAFCYYCGSRLRSLGRCQCPANKRADCLSICILVSLVVYLAFWIYLALSVSWPKKAHGVFERT